MLIAEVAQYLHNAKIGVYQPNGIYGNIFLNYLPDSPDEAIALYSTGGATGDIGIPIEQPSIQVIIRGSESLAQSIYDKLHGLANTNLVVGGIRIIGCEGVSSAPARLPDDDKGRHIFSLNFRFIIFSTTRSN